MKEENSSAFKMEFSVFKWAEKFCNCMNLSNFFTFTNNKLLINALTTAKLDATKQRQTSALERFFFDITKNQDWG